MKSIAIIPARGGSKGIPRKSIRPLAGKPMIHYAIQACLDAAVVDRVVVSTDDDEIAMLAERFGASVIMRPPELADDVSTLDPVIAHAVSASEEQFSEAYDIVYTVQPTSPLVQSRDLESADKLFQEQPGIDTVLSVVDDRHLCWTQVEGKAVPAYTARVNRQQLPQNFRETGAVIACRRVQLERGTRIGSQVALLEMPAHRSFDIDNFSDLYLCESILNRKTIVFAVVGYPEVGLGHAYRAMMLAHELVQYKLHFICEEESALAARQIRQHNYDVDVCPDGQLADAVLALEPDLVINDILDTEADYMRRLSEHGCRVVNFEDLGEGMEFADLVVNALYPNRKPARNVLVGPEYFCLRDEFLYVPPRSWSSEVKRLLVTFGGVDEGNLTARVIGLIAPFCANRSIEIDVITGPGFSHQESLQSVAEKHEKTQIRLVNGTARISDYMYQADMAITSGGRTVLELASLRVPTVVICQNERETTHEYASWENGVINLGFRGDVNDETLQKRVEEVVNDVSLRAEMRTRSSTLDLSRGKQRVIQSIVALLDTVER